VLPHLHQLLEVLIPVKEVLREGKLGDKFGENDQKIIEALEILVVGKLIERDGDERLLFDLEVPREGGKVACHVIILVGIPENLLGVVELNCGHYHLL
jgi:hypothetical protein